MSFSDIFVNLIVKKVKNTKIWTAINYGKIWLKTITCYLSIFCPAVREKIKEKQWKMWGVHKQALPH